MYIQQLYTNCLAQAAYYVESNGEAAIIDPIRDVQAYLDMAAERKATIKYVFETHFHADFVSGHVDLARKTGADIVFGPQTNTSFKAIHATDGQEFTLGNLTIRVLHTPGHTPDSSCYLLLDEHKKERAVFTGDTLFIGDVGRPDLLSGFISKEELASQLFDSLTTKIKTLPDDVLVYPAHGEGSACGKKLSCEKYSTLGEQKQTNYALLITDKQQFINEITEGQPLAPSYFSQDVALNKNGYSSLDEVVQRNRKALSEADVQAFVKKGSVLLDTRPAEQFAAQHLPNSINIGLNGSFAIWVGTLIPVETDLILITEPGKEEEAIIRLARVGFENVKGYVNALSSFANVEKITTTEPENIAAYPNAQVIDVRQMSEWETGHLANAFHAPLSTLQEQFAQWDKNKEYLVTCQGGYRSMAACSLMKRAGFTRLINLNGGMNAVTKAGISTVVESAVQA